jgi:hypothetical protein
MPSHPPSPSPPSTPDPKPADGFEFGFTLSYSADQDYFRLPHKFGEVLDVRTNQVVLRVRGGATSIWPMALLFDRTGMPYLVSGWRRLIASK